MTLLGRYFHYAAAITPVRLPRHDMGIGYQNIVAAT